MDLAASVVKDVSVLRRMLFATMHLPRDMPNYWETITFFSMQGNESVTAAQVKILMENLQALNDQAFSQDSMLIKELMSTEHAATKQPLGVVLVSTKEKCRSCGGRLQLRADRPSTVTLYTEHLGTVPATHYHRLCANKRK
jgi:hypothetical protein